MSTGERPERSQAIPRSRRMSVPRLRRMARRAGDGSPILTPAGRRAIGWIAALVLIGGIGFVVRLVGTGSGAAPAATSGSGTPAASPAPIAFGTAFDPETGQVADAVANARYVSGDTFAYSIASATVPAAVWVEVRRADGEVVQAAPESEQRLGPEAPAVAFSVPAANLISAFGSGSFVMRIYLDPAAQPVAEGTFELVEPLGSASPSGS